MTWEEEKSIITYYPLSFTKEYYPNKYLFAGEQYDSNLSDYYLRARYYDTNSGRFTRRDTYEGSLG
jgi:RHS repeat-associated protein